MKEQEIRNNQFWISKYTKLNYINYKKVLTYMSEQTQRTFNGEETQIILGPSTNDSPSSGHEKNDEPFEETDAHQHQHGEDKDIVAMMNKIKNAMESTVGKFSFEHQDDEYSQKNLQKQEIERIILQARENTDKRNVDTKEILSEIKKCDRFMGRNLIHHQSLDQNFKILQLNFMKIIKSSPSYEFCVGQIEDLVNQRDKYGNTPLALACIYNNEAKYEIKLKCIKYLMDCGSDPNIRNYKSGFTPLHWAARYGEKETVDVLLEKGGIEYIPDSYGCTALDYAGKFGHQDVVVTLIEKTWNRAKKYLEECSDNFSNDKNKILIRQSQLEFDENGESTNIFGCHEFLMSPVLHSNMLYWASSLPERKFVCTKIKLMIDELRALPEAKIYADSNKTSIHAAAIGGNWKKLKILLANINQRYFGRNIFKKSQGKLENNFSVMGDLNKNNLSEYQKIDLQYAELLNSDEDLKQSLHMLKHFQKDIELLKEKHANFTLNLDFTDQNGMTPLHYAFQYGREECAEILLLYNGSSIHISAESGIRPRDIIQHHTIRNLVGKFYQKVDLAINNRQIDSMTGLMIRDQTSKEDLQKWQQEMFQYQENIGVCADGDHHEDSLDSHDLSDECETEKLDKKQFTHRQQITDKICLENLLDYYYTHHEKKDADMIQKVLMCKQHLPKISQMAMLVKIKEKQKAQLNSIIDTLIKHDFTLRMFQAANNQESSSFKFYYIVLDMDLSDLENFAEQLEYPMMLIDSQLKYRYMKGLKQKYEPFRSKDIQEIFMKIITKSLPVYDLKIKGIICDLFLIHNMNEIYLIDQKFIETSFVDLYKQNYRNNADIDYNAIDGMKNYLGERWGFLYAFQNFYTAKLIPVAIVGAIVSWHQYRSKEWIGSVTFTFSVGMSIWMTVFIEQWKRKENELKLRWGTIFDDDTQQMEYRDEFIANEEFDFQNDKVNRVDYNKHGSLFKILNGIVMTVLISITIVSFYVSKSSHGSLAGAINTAVVGMINFIYQTVAQRLIDLENHKFQSQYNQSFIHKTFIFKFINAHIIILWKIQLINLDTTNEEILEQMYNLWYFIVTMMGSKIVSLFVGRFIAKFAQVYLNKFLYFKTCKEKAMAQQPVHENYVSSLWDSKRQDINNFEQSKKDMEIFKHSKMSSPLNLEFKRLVTIFNRKDGKSSCIQEDPLLVDQVELNQRLLKQTMTIELVDLSETFILFSFATLYGFILPTICSFILMYNVFAMRFERRAHLHFKQRIPLIKENSIGYWLYVLQMIGYTTIFMQIIFIFKFRNFFGQTFVEQFSWIKTAFKEKIDQANIVEGGFLLSKEDVIFFLIVLILLEHAIIGIKLYIDVYINDKPNWVLRSEMKVQKDIAVLNNAQNDIQKTQMIKIMKTQIKRMKKSFNETYSSLSKKYQIIHTEYNKNLVENKLLRANQMGKSKSQKIKLPPIEQKQTPINSMQSTPKSKTDEKNFLLAQVEQRIGSGLAYNYSHKPMLESVLNKQLQKLAVKSTFNQIESQILSRRLANLQNNKNVLVNCTLCQKDFAIGTCKDCEMEPHCNDCYTKMHPQGTQLSQHKFELLQQNDQTPIQHSESQNYGQGQTQIFRKFEKFSFELEPGNQEFDQIRKYFAIMKQIYISMNNIDRAKEEIDFVKLLFNGDYSILGPNNKDLIVQKLRQEPGLFESNVFQLSEESTQQKLPSVQNFQTFNCEELLFLNRISFYLLQKYGPTLKFQQFMNMLKILQNGKHDEKIDLVCDILQALSDYGGRVQVDHVNAFIMASMPQGFQPLELTKLMTRSELKQALVQNEKVLKCILQSE